MGWRGPERDAESAGDAREPVASPAVTERHCDRDHARPLPRWDAIEIAHELGEEVVRETAPRRPTSGARVTTSAPSTEHDVAGEQAHEALILGTSSTALPLPIRAAAIQPGNQRRQFTWIGNRLADERVGARLVQKRLAELGASIPSKEERTPAAFARFVKAEMARWSPMLKAPANAH